MAYVEYQLRALIHCRLRSKVELLWLTLISYSPLYLSYEGLRFLSLPRFISTPRPQYFACVAIVVASFAVVVSTFPYSRSVARRDLFSW